MERGLVETSHLPGFDLGVGHLQRLGQSGSLCRGEVFLLMESLLKLADLHTRE